MQPQRKSRIALIKAAEQGRIWTRVEQAYKGNANKVDTYGITVLISAATSAHSRIASILLFPRA